MAHRSLSRVFATLLIVQVSAAQESWTVRAYAGIGIGAASMPDLADYANVQGGPAGERIEDFQSLFDLDGGIEIQVVENWSIGIDYVSAGRTIETAPSQPGSGWTFEPALHMPTVIVRRMYPSESMSYGFGAGIGYHSGVLRETAPGVVTADTYSGNGPGVVVEGFAHTAFDRSFSGMISVDLRYSSIPELRKADGTEPRTGNGALATLSVFAVSLRFGLSFSM